ncbi:hypothetical protein O7543_10210 [Solwaraspora sp. WMMA2080]|nr:MULTISPECIES: hypothetical protein [unclassified Solwaraspora]WBB98674.1 hypothetical protein O7553_07155 [Solwaraspora sp. WMMA2059]WBC22773.1 hypothetical protein O7543_10210 [Solwaraspora sp. WMMA2080]
MPGLGAVTDDGETARRAAAQQHLPLRVGQLLRLVDHDVRERAGQRVRVGVRPGRLVDQRFLQILVAQHRQDAFAVVVAVRVE